MNKALDKALSILEYVANEPDRPKRLGEIAGNLGLNAATAAHILRNLCEMDYVEQVSPRQGYILGPMVYYLARGGLYRQDIVKTARPILAALAGELGEMVVLASWRHGRRYLLDYIERTPDIRVTQNYDVADDAYHTATGNILLANQPEDELSAFVKAHGEPDPDWARALSVNSFVEAMARIRKERFVERQSGESVQIAMPVFEGGSVVAAVGIAVPLSRYGGSRRDMILNALRSAVERIGRALDERAAESR